MQDEISSSQPFMTARFYPIPRRKFFLRVLPDWAVLQLSLPPSGFPDILLPCGVENISSPLAGEGRGMYFYGKTR